MKLDNTHSYLHQTNAGDLIKSNGEYGALKLVSQQFEAQFLQTVLKQMRSASDAISDEDNPLSPQKDSLYRDWHDAELAGRLSQMQSTGLASVMTEQLARGLKSGSDSVAFSEQVSAHTAANRTTTISTTAMQPSLITPLNAK